MYVTDALKAIAENTAKAVSQGTWLKTRYIEMIDSVEKENRPQKESNRTAEDVINQIKNKINKINGG